METILITLFKKLVDLFGDRLGKAVFKPRKHKARAALLDLNAQILELQRLIGELIAVFDTLIAKPSHFNAADARLNRSLPMVRRVLATMALDLKTLAPEFAIMAEEAAPAIEDLRHHEMLFIDHLGLLKGQLISENRVLTFKESLSDYRKRLRTLRRLAERTNKQLTAFIKKSYNWEMLIE
jgi:hypothetical protein